MSNVIILSSNIFNNDITLLNDEFKDNIYMLMFSKTDCKYCNECTEEYKNASLQINNNRYKFAKINCDNEEDLVNKLKNNKMILSNRERLTFPTFLIYKDSKLTKEYLGIRTAFDFIINIKDVDEKVSRLADKIHPIFPIRNNTIFNLYKSARNCFWIEQEIDFSKDKFDWDTKLNDNERYFLENILSFFSQSDQIVNSNLEERFSKDVDSLPSDLIVYTKLFYNFQKMMEDIHSITYESLLDTYIVDSKKKDLLKRSMEHIPAIKKKSNWATKWIDNQNASFGTRLIAFAILEGVFFSGSFCAIFWIKEKNILNGLTKSNEFISRDEGLHYMFAITLYNILKNRNDYDIGCNDSTIIDIIVEAVEIEKEFITSSFSCNLIGMNAEQMCNYIEFVADKLLENLDIEPLYKTKNPFQFMENLALQNKSNFFETRVSEYAKANSTATSQQLKLQILDDF